MSAICYHCIGDENFMLAQGCNHRFLVLMIIKLMKLFSTNQVLSV